MTATMAYLPDDLEDRYYAAKAAVEDFDRPMEERMEAMRDLQAWNRRWRELADKGELTWQQRRRIRALRGGDPLTPAGGATSNLRYVEQEQRERAWRREMIRLHGKEGFKAIQTLTDRLMAKRPGIPEEQAVRWAERKVAQGQLRGRMTDHQTQTRSIVETVTIRSGKRRRKRTVNAGWLVIRWMQGRVK